MLDLKISGAKVVDGAGNPWRHTDIGIRGDRIVALDDLSGVESAQTIEAGGLVACPGFIDIHSHSDLSLVDQHLGLASLQQGITTQVGGNCGHSLAPVRTIPEALRQIERDHGLGDLELDWRTFAEYLDWQERRGVGINLAPLAGHGAVRRYVLGPEGEGGEATDITAAQLEALCQELDAAMAAGAFGMSVGLEYPPGRNARTAELIEMCRVVARHGGFYATHMRSEGQAPGMEWWGAIVETIEISRLSGARANISHFKADQRGAWFKTDAALRLLEDARAHGVQITADVYPWPYAAVGYLYEALPPGLAEDGLAELLAKLRDPEARAAIRQQVEDGIAEWTNPATSFGWGAIGVVETADPADQGLSVEDIARNRGADPLDVCFELLLRDNGLTRSSVGVMSEANIERKLRHPLTMVGTDGITVDCYPATAAPGCPPPKLHPRTTGTYPRLLGKYVRERGIMTLPEAIRKSTSLPAQTAGIAGRGMLLPGTYADVVIIDPLTVADVGTFEDPHHPPRGIPWVIVNGRVAVAEGQPTRVLAGRVLRRGRD